MRSVMLHPDEFAIATQVSLCKYNQYNMKKKKKKNTSNKPNITRANLGYWSVPDPNGNPVALGRGFRGFWGLCHPPPVLWLSWRVQFGRELLEREKHRLASKYLGENGEPCVASIGCQTILATEVHPHPYLIIQITSHSIL